MLGPPAFPSQPPPPREDAVRPMSLVAAALWVFGSLMGTVMLWQLIGVLQGARPRDAAARTACQVGAYLLVLFGILRAYGPEKSIRAFVALRTTHPGFYPLALVLGGSATTWASWLAERFLQRFPPPEPLPPWAERFFQAGPREQLVYAFGVVVVGPFVEELLFRGAIFGPLGKRYPLSLVIFVTAAFFAFIHIGAWVIPSIFLVGLALGGIRAMSGSLVPPLLFHAAFNGTSLVVDYLNGPHPAAGDTPTRAALASLALFAAAYAASVALAKFSRLALRARQAAADC